MKSSPNKAKVKKPMPIYLIILLAIAGIIAVYLIITNSTQVLESLGWSNHSGMLKIVESPWTGWSLKQPDDTIEYIPVESEKAISLGGLGDFDSYSLYIGEANDNSIEMNQLGLYLAQGAARSQGIDLNSGCSSENDFTLQRGETVELSTCSMDAGITWYITYVR